MPTGPAVSPLRSSLAGLLLAALAFTAAPARAAESGPAATLDLAVARAQASLQKGDLAAAQLHYGEALLEGWVLLAKARAAEGRTALAVQALGEAEASAGEDPKALFLLGTQHLWLKQPDSAERLFVRALAARPIPQFHVLIGRAFRDAGEYERARAHFRSALSQDPKVRHARYYLGMVELADGASGPDRLEAAMAEFRAELAVTPEDPLANDQLGVALLDAGHPTEALGPLERAVKADPRFLHVAHLGRAQLALDRPAEAVVTLRRALALSAGQEAEASDLRKVHYQLGLALRKLGDAEGAAKHLAEARQAVVAEGMEGNSMPPAGLPAAGRGELERRVTAELARTYLNLGVIEAQAQRFPEAAARFEKAAELDPDFPQVQSSLGIAYFNARQFDRAVAPLARAVAAGPPDRGLTRMLAMAWLNTEAFVKAADLLRDDPERESDPSLQFAYGMALVRSERAAEAEDVFSRLLRAHGESAELSVLLGQAHAQQGDFEAALESLRRALALKPDVAEASSTMGVIYLRQGRLAEAEEALRAETAAHPGDLRAQQDLAAVLDLLQRGEEAVPLLRRVVEAKPQQAGAQYLLGKILLAQGAAAEAVRHLEAAVQATPDDARAHYQLGRAYQTVGQGARAEQEFERFRQLKDKR